MGTDDAPLLAAAVAPAGQGLAALMRALRTVRGPRPIHTTGVVLDGVLHRRPLGPTRSGIGWIDDPGEADVPVVARLSRGAGLPAPLPDVIGLAIRPEDGGGDLLLSSTGIGVPGRFLLAPRRTPAGAVLSTLMPYRGAHGPVLIAARSRTPTALPARMEQLHAALRMAPWRLDLLFASPAGRWHRFADLELRAAEVLVDSGALRFDPVLHPPRGAGTYEWTRVLREPAYAAGRRPSRRT